MQQKALILESHHSTHIEGTALSLEQAKDILEGKKVKGVNRDDEKELLNYKKAMDFISKYLGKEDPVTEGIIRELHKITVKGVRGEKAVKHLLKNTKITVNDYQKVASCIRRTAQRDLEDLVTKKVIKIVAQSPTDPTKRYVLL